MIDLRTRVAGISLKNPVITASGTYGFGFDFTDFYSPSELGGISLKGTTLNKRTGNEPGRCTETPSGMLNCVGLQNPGIEYFIKEELVRLKTFDTVKIANVAGAVLDDYEKICERLSDEDIDMVELNISCPNVKNGGAAFGTDPKIVEKVTLLSKNMLKNKPLIVKLTPNVSDIKEIARAAEAAGADAISLINTLTGMVIDTKTRRPVLKNNTGGLSGPAVFPVALRMVWEVCKTVNIDVIGLGGVNSADAALQMMMAGAKAVQVGTANFTDVYTPLKIIDGLRTYLNENGIEKITDIIGTVQIW